MCPGQVWTPDVLELPGGAHGLADDVYHRRSEGLGGGRVQLPGTAQERYILCSEKVSGSAEVDDAPLQLRNGLGQLLGGEVIAQDQRPLRAYLRGGGRHLEEVHE